MTSPFIDDAKFIGKYKVLENGDIEFNIDSFYFLTNWVNGWTEGKYQAIGKILFKKVDKGFQPEVLEKFEMGEIDKGEVRMSDDYYQDEKGLKPIKDRVDRIMAVCDFLKQQKNYPEFFGSALFKTQYGESFYNQTAKFLFPELFPDSVVYSKTSNEYKTNDLSSDVKLADTIVWNKKYTQKNFPKDPIDLQGIRNSGTIYKDYEEAIGLFVVFYNMDYFFNKALVNSKLIVKEK